MAYPPQQGPYGGQQAPQGQPYGGYPQQGGPYGGPPPRNKAPLLATLMFVVALLAGLGITGFVAPGFFLSDDDSESSADGGDGTGSAPGGPGGLPGGGPADGPGGGPADGPADGPGGGSGDDGPGGGSSGGSSVDGEAFAEEFVTALNKLDSEAANSMYCPDAVGGMVDYVIKKDPELAIASTEGSKYYLKVTLSGTLGGKPLRSGKLSVELNGGNAPCVFTFSAG
ncbi:hypothetical protein [Actinophytocola glycyrrhizae]|uniref:Uncharacterized protein n=1 Tax=Actinophytocola glycyrrhizae TaxID=2044873 RepID=A0ABV9S6W5_9PSEU